MSEIPSDNIEAQTSIGTQKSRFSSRIFLFIAFGLVALLVLFGVLFSWYHFPNFVSHPLVIKYRLGVNNGIDFLLTTLPKKLFGKPISYWWPKQVVVEDEMDNIFVYSLASRIVDVNPVNYTITVEDFAGQLLEFPLSGEVSENGAFKFPVFELPSDFQYWQRKDYILTPGDPTLEEVFCTSELVTLVWTDERPLSFWTRIDGYFNKNRLSEAPSVTVHIFKQIYPSGRKQTPC